MCPARAVDLRRAAASAGGPEPQRRPDEKIAAPACNQRERKGESDCPWQSPSFAWVVIADSAECEARSGGKPRIDDSSQSKRRGSMKKHRPHRVVVQLDLDYEKNEKES